MATTEIFGPFQVRSISSAGARAEALGCKGGHALAHVLRGLLCATVSCLHQPPQLPYSIPQVVTQYGDYDTPQGLLCSTTLVYPAAFEPAL